MAEKKKNKKRTSIYSILGKIGDILLIPIMIVALISSISMLASRSRNKPTSFLGHSLVTVLSGSMKNDGFLVGDTVMTEKVNGVEIKLGDVIAFYNYRDYSDPSIGKLELVVKYNNTTGVGVDTSSSNVVYGTIDLDSIEFKNVEHKKTVEDAQKANTRINFHKVVAIYVDETNGTFYFRTKGVNNASEDTNTIREDFIVGRYVNTPRAIRDIIKFCASALGMILLVCIPLSLQVLLQCLSLIEQLGIMSNEKALLTGRASFKDPEFKRDFDGNVMEVYNKVYFYYLVPKEDKPLAKEFMWSNILDAEKLSKKNQKLLNTVNTSEQKLEKSDNAYWNEWLENTKGYDHKKINKYYQNLMTEKILKKTKINSMAKVIATANSDKPERKTDKPEEKLAKPVVKKESPKMFNQNQELKRTVDENNHQKQNVVTEEKVIKQKELKEKITVPKIRKPQINKVQNKAKVEVLAKEKIKKRRLERINKN